MSSKKKPIFECAKCGRHFLSKDEPKHVAGCPDREDKAMIPSLDAGGLFVGLVQPVEDFQKYLPNDATGWSKFHSILVNPSTLNLWGIVPRQPCRMKNGETTLIVTPWPCKEVSMLRIATRSAPNESLVQLTPISDYSTVKRMEVRLDEKFQRFTNDTQLGAFLEAYLMYGFFSEDSPIIVSYFGHKITLHPITPIDVKMENMKLGEEAPTMNEQSLVLHLASGCSILVTQQGQKRNSAPETRDPLEAIGGCSLVKKALVRYIVEPIKKNTNPCSLLLWGLAGNGKTLLVNAVEKILGANTLKIMSLDELAEKQSLIGEKTTLLVDITTYQREHKAYSILSELMSSGKVYCVLLTARSADDVEIGTRIRFPREIELPVPNETERLEILRVLSGDSLEGPKMMEIARITHGFTGSDLKNLLELANYEQGDDLVQKLEKAQRLIRPTGIRQFILEVPDVKWASIGGNQALKLEVQQAVLWPRQYPEAFARFGVQPPSGILLYGPPGCSKTLIARALANESKMNFLAVKGPELFSKWVGESEKAVRDLFARARQVAPTIVFFDEIDAVGQSRGATGSSVGDRVLAQLLTELDGLEKRSGVILLAATNRPDQLDSALLRPGRLDRAIYVGLPDEESRREIIELSLKTMNANNAIADDLDIDELVRRTDGYSGAEIVALCQTAAMIAMRESVHIQAVSWHHFTLSLRAIVPRTDKSLIDVYEKFSKGNTSV
ncbi:unnamed protein product, partial [Mesorhabditis belari]|uniref:AAA+ ATPase domain-containing protein n=1 Tax=Mesorhabditis belari TaxID=2138241 RepID=A0AAF3F4E7_9BILA